MQFVFHGLLRGWVMNFHLALAARYCTSQKTARRSKEKLQKITKDVKILFKRKLVKAGMPLFAKLQMRGFGKGLRGT